MNILSIDCAGKVLTVTLTAGGKLYSADSGNAGNKKHNSLILPFTDELLNRAGLTVRDVDVIACVVGPGSFTGIRIGVSTAHALARAVGAKLIAVNALQARALNEKGSFAVALECRPRESYAAVFDGDCFKMISCKACEEEEIAAPGMRVVRHEGYLSATDLSMFAQAMADRGEFVSALSPLYLKKSQAERLADGE